MVCTAFACGKRHDFRLFKESGIRLHTSIRAKFDSGFQGVLGIHVNSDLPKKRSKKCPLTVADRRRNRLLSSERVLNEHVIGFVKRFRILSDCYRNRRKRFGLRFNLLAGICNFDLG